MCDELDEQESPDDEAMVEFAAPPVIGSRPRRWSRKSMFVSVGLSLAIHVVMLVILVRAGVLRVPLSLSFLGGTAGEGGVVTAGTAAAFQERPAAWLPANPVTAESVSLDYSPEMTPAEIASATKDLTGVLAEVERSAVLGVSSESGVDLSAQFPHRYPPGWKPGGGADASATGTSQSAAQSSGEGTRPVAMASGESGIRGTGGNGGDGGKGLTFSSRNRKPQYPRAALQPGPAGMTGPEGTVWLLVEVLDDGSVGTVSVDESSGNGLLDKAALEGVRGWRFEWDKSAGKPHRVKVDVPIQFSAHA